MNDFHPGDVIETSRAEYRGDRAERYDAPRRFVVDGVSAGGWLYVHPEGQRLMPRVNDYIVETKDAHLPAPGALAEEYGR